MLLYRDVEECLMYKTLKSVLVLSLLFSQVGLAGEGISCGSGMMEFQSKERNIGIAIAFASGALAFALNKQRKKADIGSDKGLLTAGVVGSSSIAAYGTFVAIANQVQIMDCNHWAGLVRKMRKEQTQNQNRVGISSPSIEPAKLVSAK
jgi:hypothetical protein